MVSTTQPTLQENDKSVTKIQAKISQLEANLNAKHRPTGSRKDQLLFDLNQEYEKLGKKRKDQCKLLVDQWQTYQQNQKASRQSEINKRQIEFNKQLEELDQEKRKNWVSHQQDKAVICHQLLTCLELYSCNTAILMFPTDILDMFWAIDIQIPVLPQELPTTIGQVELLLKN